MSNHRFRLLLWIPFAVLFGLFILWQQGTFDVGCSWCDGRGYTYRPRIPEDPIEVQLECNHCTFGVRRLEHWARTLDQALPDGPIGPYLSVSTILLGVLIWSLRSVCCKRCNGAGGCCATCNGRGRHARLDRWLMREG